MRYFLKILEKLTKARTLIKKVPLPVLIAFFSMLVLVGALFFLKSSLESKRSVTNSKAAGNLGPVVAFVPNGSEPFQKGKKYEAALVLKSMPAPIPVAFDLYLGFDQKSLRVDSISEGDLWSGVNVLAKKIDNQTGKIQFALGQGFDAKLAGGLTLVKINFTVLDVSAGKASFRVEADSALAAKGGVSLIKLSEISWEFLLK